MKKINLLLILMTLGIVFSYAQNVNVDLTVKYNSSIKSDSVYLFFYPTTKVELGQLLPVPDKRIVIHESESTFNIYPGAYTLGVLAFGSKSLNTRLYIPPVDKFEMEVVLNPVIIGWGGITDVSQIKEVTLRGDFNKFEKYGEILLSKNGNVWKLEEKPQILEDGQKYTFYVNEQETVDLLNPNILVFADWLVIKNVYSNNALIFDPSLYSLTYKESEINVIDTLKQYQFKQLVNNLNALDKEKQKIFRASSREAAIPLVDALIPKYSALENEYSPDFSQLIIPKELELMTIKSIYLDAPQGNQNDPEFKEKQKDYFIGKEFETHFIKINDLTNTLDPNSFLLTEEFSNSFIYLQSLLDEFPELASKNNFSEKHYDEFIDDFIEKSSNKKLCYSLLLQQAVMSKSTDEAKAIAIIDEIKNNPEYAEFIDNLRIERILGELNIKLGRIAPDFSVDLLNGKKINLNDYKGKFVFIDFWGSWCNPCRQEIPNIKKLYSSLSRDKLEIIGLAQDDEPNLKNYIREQNIEYPNALAPKELLAKYGIVRYPTSFLINPKGKIVRIDIRGADAMELIREEIEDYYN